MLICQCQDYVSNLAYLLVLPMCICNLDDKLYGHPDYGGLPRGLITKVLSGINRSIKVDKSQ